MLPPEHTLQLTMPTLLDQRVLDRVRAEYVEMPGMKLRIDQIARLCGIDHPMCDLVLDALVRTSFLFLQSDGTYVRSTDGGKSLPRPAKAALKSSPVVSVSRRAS